MRVEHVAIFSCEQDDIVLEKILKTLDSQKDCKYVLKLIRANTGDFKEKIKAIYNTMDFFIFISSTGIAVRTIGKLLVDKTTDPGIVVIDTLGRYVIPIASGHLGGANDLASDIAGGIGAEAVITTATDINHVFAIDTFTQKNDLAIINPRTIKYISMAVLNKEAFGVEGDYKNLAAKISTALEESGCNIRKQYPKNVIRFIEKHQEINPDENISALYLLPKTYCLGIGCKKDTPFYKIYDLVKECLEKNKINVVQIRAIATIDIKESEAGILTLKSAFGCKLYSYTAEELNRMPGEFEDSDFVKDKVGVGNVCERSACLCSEYGKKIVGKTSRDGVTLSIYRD